MSSRCTHEVDDAVDGPPRSSAIAGRGRALGAAFVATAAAAYFAALVRYGYHLGEDGDVVYMIYRTFAGHRPYDDFASGYTPAYFYSNAALLGLFGVDLVVLRWALAAANALAVVSLYLVSCRAVPVALAMVPAFAYMALMPVFAGEFTTFNVPYPAWYVVLFWNLSLLALLAGRPASRSGPTVGSDRISGAGLAWIGVGGALAGLGFGFKPNTGAFNLAALALLLLATGAPRRSFWSKALWAGFLAGVVFALAATFGLRVANRDARLLLWPVFAVAAAIAIAAPRRFASAPPGGFAAQVAALLVGFGAVTLPWVAYYLVKLGIPRFLHDVLFVGSGHELFFYLPFRPLGLWDAAAAAGALALLAASRWQPANRRPWLLFGGIAAAAGAVLALWWAPMPDGFHRAITQRLEYLAYGAALIVHWGGVALLARRLWSAPDSTPGVRPHAELALAISAPLLFLSMYPRGDFFHWVLSAPLTLALAVVLYWRVAEPWLGSATWAALPLYAGVALFWLPGLSLAAHTPFGSLARLDLPRAQVVLETGKAARLDALRATVEYIDSHSSPDATLLGFPNLHLLNFLSGRHVPGRHGSFNPGWPDHTIEAEIVDSLHRARTPLVVINLSQQLYIGNAPVYYFMLREYLRRNYRLATTIGDYQVLERVPAAGEPTGGPPVGDKRYAPAASAPAESRRTTDVPLDCAAAVRRGQVERSDDAAKLAACWRSDSAPLQEEAANLARAARDPAGALALAEALRDGTLVARAQLPAVRTISESADARSVPAIVGALTRLQGRVHDELVTALLNTAVRSFLDGHQLHPRAEGLEEIRADPGLGPPALLWLTSEDQRLRYVGAWLAGVRQDRAAVPDLRRLLKHPSVEFQALAAEALMQIGDDEGVAEVLVDGMAKDEMYLPTVLLLWSRAHPERARTLLAERLRTGNALQRESLTFLAGTLADPALAAAVLPGLSDPEPRVRMASLWAAGFLVDERSRPLLTQALESDPDHRVRRFASVALLRLYERRSGASLDQSSVMHFRRGNSPRCT